MNPCYWYTGIYKYAGHGRDTNTKPDTTLEEDFVADLDSATVSCTRGMPPLLIFQGQGLLIRDS